MRVRCDGSTTATSSGAHVTATGQFFAGRIRIAGQCGGEPDVLGSGLLGSYLDSGRGEQVIGQTRRSQSDAPLRMADSVTDPSMIQLVCATPVGPSSPLRRLQNLGHQLWAW